MAAINQEDLLGSFIPDVYISQIVLESSGTPLVDNNPHIDVASERSVSVQGSNDNLLVTIRLVVKDKISNDLISNWFDKIDIQKYLRIKIFQSTDQRSTGLLSLSQDMIEMVDSDRRVSPKDMRFKVAASVFESDKVNFVTDKLSRTVTSQTISPIKRPETNKFIDEEGNEISNFNYTVKFVVNKAFPEHLAYFVITSFDVQSLAKDFNLEYDTISLDKMNGKVTSDVVIDDGDLVSRSFVFLDPDGKVWPGPVHLNENGQWRSKSEEEPNSVDLTREIVTNNKIQDFRNVKDIQKLQFDFSSVNSKLGDIEVKMSSNDKIDPKRVEEYFSDFNLATDRNGDTKFFFSINYEKLITELSLYGGLVKKAGSRFVQEMMVQTKIKELRIVRRRVRQGSNVSRFVVIEGLQKFDNNEPDELICIGGEKSFGTFVQNNTIKGALREVQLVLDSTVPGVRHFTGMDKTMSDVTDGYYQYGIELEIDDGSLEFFKNKVLDLRDALAELNTYYVEASKLSLSKFIAEVQDPHIQHPSENAGTTEKLIGNFDIESNRFTQKFINQMTRKYSGRNLRAAPWIAPIVIYADVLDMFTDAFQSRRDRGVVLNSLFTYTSPKTGNPSGILAVIKLIESLIGSLETIVGTVSKKSPKRFLTATNQSFGLYSGRNVKRSIKLNKFFNKLFDSNTIKGVGLDYLSNGHDDTKNDDGLKRISGSDFLQRINSETLRYFKDTDPDISLNTGDTQITLKDRISNTSFSFLSPSRVDLPRKSISLLDNIGAPITRSKRNRVLENINDSKSLKKDRFAHIHSTMMMQNLTTKPIASLFDKFGTSKAREDLSVDAIEEMLGDILSEHGSVLIQPIELEAEKDTDNNIILKKLPDFTFKIAKDLKQIPSLALLPKSKTQSLTKTDEKDNGGKNVFMKSLTKGLAAKGTKNKKALDLKKPNIRKSSQTFPKNSNSVNIVSLLNPKKLSVQTNGDTKTITGFKKPMTEDKLKKLPNQLKSIMLFNSSNGAVKVDKLKNLKFQSVVEKVEQEPENKFNFEMLKQLERLTGYSVNKRGILLIKKPIWKMLTQQDYDALIGKEIVCRMIKYENKDIGLVDNKGTDSPSYDDYFILVPKKIQTPVTARRIEPPKIVNVVEKIRISLQENFPGLQIAERDKKRTNRDLVLTNLASKFTLVDVEQETEILSRDNKRKVKVKNKNIEVPTDLAVEAFALDCQSVNIDQEFLSSNTIGLNKFDKILSNPNVLKTIVTKQKLAIAELDEIDDDRCSAFGKFRPNGQICSDKK